MIYVILGYGATFLVMGILTLWIVHQDHFLRRQLKMRQDLKTKRTQNFAQSFSPFTLESPMKESHRSDPSFS